MSYPKELLRDIYWSFNESTFSDINKFIDELKAYHKEISNQKLALNFNDIALNFPKVVLQYVKYAKDDILEPQVLINSDNGTNFTFGELLFKIHNLVGINLADDDNCYFEGISFATDDDPDFPETPVYFLDTGS